MMRSRVLPIVAASAGLAAGVLVAGCASESAPAGPEPTCADRRIAEASAHRYDPAGAIAVGHGIAESHPELKGIAAAVADHQRRRPDTERMVITDRRAMPADVSFVYTMVLVDLAARPDLATPEAIAVLEDAAVGPDDDASAEFLGGGMIGVYRLITDSRRLLKVANAEVAELSNLVDRQAEAVEDAGVHDILWTECARAPDG